MNYHGTVRFVNGENVIHSFVYSSREMRNTIVERWKQLYKEVFYLYNVQIAPEVIEEKIEKRVIAKKKPLERLQEESKQRFERHLGVYGNLQIYKYDK